MTNLINFKGNKEKIATGKDKNPSLLKRFKNLLGVGPLLLLLGLLIEGLTIVIRQWFSFYVPITFELQIILTVFCVSVWLLGMIWFNRSLDLIKVNLLDEKRKLVTHGPFNYVRHPMYSTLLWTIPPIVMIWFSDLLFLIPWILLFILSHYIVTLEEQKLIEIFGVEYEKYRKFVPLLLPYKGAGGRRYCQQCDEVKL
ncbi:isoprenylcysteine carboxylmethyltransferase family protein [candidate division KSB1 bacterium]|nr:isoprenylcysteine carboxylmethyltransferase family protein [candidate division KSB1 bacterium]